MTPRERVLTTLQHEQPDRIPLVIGVSNATGIKIKPYQGIKNIAGIHAPDSYLYDWPELGTAAIDEEAMRRLHSDVRGVSCKFLVRAVAA
jgi:uroporphyrinogen decarboxylase